MAHILFPAEWHPQGAIQITWPHKESDWRYIIDEVSQFYVSLSKEILKHTKLIIVCPNLREVEKHFSTLEQKNLILIKIDSNDTWTRDHGAISVFIDNKPVIYNFGFNGWGLKFAANLDNQITRHLFEDKIFKPEVGYQNHLNFILEGGSVESDGEGTLLTTTECLMAPNRNQPLTKEDIEKRLKELFGLKRVLWLNNGYLAGDDTDSHIDTLARFCDANTIAYVKCVNASDEHFQELKKMEAELQAFRTLKGEPYHLIPLPMAEPVYEDDHRLPATYANFLIMDHVVLVPTYAMLTDILALDQLKKAFPKKKLVPIDCRTLIKQHGSLHCITMQYPKGFI